MVKHFLITRPKYGKETPYIYSFSKGIVAIAREDKDIQMTELEREKVTRRNLESSLLASNPELVFLNGHGDELSVWGHEDEVILDGDNIKLTRGRIVYALACESLAKLGQIAIEEGVKAYIGYRGKFKWVVDLSRTSSPDKDKNAAPFRKICHVLGKSLLSGMSAGVAIEQTKNEYRKLIKNYGRSEDTFGDAPLIGLMLSLDLMFLGMEGDPRAAF